MTDPSTEKTPRVLVVEDDPAMRDLLALELADAGLPVVGVGSAREALVAVQTQAISCIVLDLGLPDRPGTELLSQLRTDGEDLPIVVVTGSDETQVAVDCMRMGASDFVQKPFEPHRLKASVRNAHESGLLRARLHSQARAEGLGAIVGESAELRVAIQTVLRVARTDLTVLIQGESGTGKELFARAIHAESTRALAPFVAVNVGAIPSGLIESELFGHVKGAFSGADRERQGLFREADGGTLFLDEIGELEPDLQVRLLRVLQEQEVRPVGSSETVPVNVRVVAATHQDLEGAVQKGSFRQDLLYRLAGFPLPLPALRERSGDVRILARFFLDQATTRLGAPVLELSEEACALLEAYPWPGNIRQLQNAMERAAVLSEGTAVDPLALPPEVRGNGGAGSVPLRAVEALPTTAEDILPMAEEERRILQRALELTAGNVTEAAVRLRIGRATLYRRIREYGLDRGSSSDPSARDRRA